MTKYCREMTVEVKWIYEMVTKSNQIRFENVEIVVQNYHITWIRIGKFKKYDRRGWTGGDVLKVCIVDINLVQILIWHDFKNIQILHISWNVCKISWNFRVAKLKFMKRVQNLMKLLIFGQRKEEGVEGPIGRWRAFSSPPHHLYWYATSSHEQPTIIWQNYFVNCYSNDQNNLSLKIIENHEQAQNFDHISTWRLKLKNVRKKIRIILE